MTTFAAFSPDRIDIRKKALRAGSIGFLAVAVCCFATATAFAERTLTLNNVPNACGGTLQVSGTGWGVSPNTIKLTAKNVPGSSGHTEDIGVAVSDHNKFSADLGYSFPAPSPVPNCGATSTLVTVTATGEHGNKVSSDVYLPASCTIVWSACPA